MKDEVLKLIREKGVLLEQGLIDVLDGFESIDSARGFLEGLERISGNKIITASSLSKNVGYVKSIVNDFGGDAKKGIEKVFVRLGISLEITRERQEPTENKQTKARQSYQLFYSDTTNARKIEVKDFVAHFRARYQSLQRILMQRPEVQQNLTSISKLGTSRSSVSLIGILTDKRTTKNKNLVLKFEDLTGEINVLVRQDSECFEKANEIQFDDVVAIKGSGSKEIVFAYDIFFPDSFLFEKKSFNEDISVAFISDIHAGSAKHLGKEFQKFIDWLNSEDEAARKIKYIFIVGDNVDGVGIFPGQERVLAIKSVKSQYDLLASYLNQVPKDIVMFMCPGQHDAVRVPEPQPIIGKEYGKSLYEIPNLVLVPNPTNVRLTEGEKEFNVLMYHGASIHTFINEISELRLAKAHRCPAKAIKQMLKRRHLAPMHGVSHSIVYVPNREEDPLVIKQVPDVLCTGEVHRLDIDSYNGVLIITGSCWQSQTEYEEKVGNVPDPCKVPILNLKSRELKILDFGDEE